MASMLLPTANSGNTGISYSAPTLVTPEQSLIDYTTKAAPAASQASRQALNTLMPGYSDAFAQSINVLSKYLSGNLSSADNLFLNSRAQEHSGGEIFIGSTTISARNRTGLGAQTRAPDSMRTPRSD